MSDLEPAAQPAHAPFRALITLALSALYFVGLSIHPLLSESSLAVVCLGVLFLLSTTTVLVRSTRDPLDPLRLIALIILLIYCIAPMFSNSFDWYFLRSKTALLGWSSLYILVSFLFVCFGYFAGPKDSKNSSPANAEVNQRAVLGFGLALFLAGFLAYFISIVLAGGTSRIISGDESRVQFFVGIGWLYWATFLMVPGGCLYFLAASSSRMRMPILHAWPMILTFTLLILLQGRFRAIRAIMCLAILWHYRVGRLRSALISTSAAVGFAVFVFVGYARDPRIRHLLFVDPLSIVREVVVNFFDYSQVILGDTISRIPQVMLAFDSFPIRSPYEWGKTIFVALNPFFRYVGLGRFQVENPGTVFFHLARPDYPSWIETGYHTSLFGEMLANFPWYLTPPIFFLFGFIVRSLYVRLVIRSRDPISLAVYSLVLFPLLSMLVVGVGLVLFELLIVLSPLPLAHFLWRRPSSPLEIGSDRVTSDNGIQNQNVNSVGTIV